MEKFKCLAVLISLFSCTGGQDFTGQDFTCLELRPSSFDLSQFQPSSLFSLETSTEGTYVTGNDIRVTITTMGGLSFSEVYLAAQDIMANEFIGTWITPISSDYTRIECFGGPTVLSYSSSTSQSSLTFTWRLTDLSSTSKFIIRATVIQNGQDYLQVQSGLFTIETVANSPPLPPTCPDSPVTVSTAPGGTSARVTYDDVTCSDNQGTITAFCSQPPGETLNIGITPVTCTCTDDGGLSSTCSFVIVVQETVANSPPLPPTCPDSPVTVSTAPGGTSARVTYDDVTCSDNQGTITAFCSQPSGETLNIGITPVTCTCTDDGGLSSTCSFVIVVQATVANSPPLPPTCPGSPVTVSTAPGETSARVTYDDVTCSDNQGTITAFCSQPSGETLNIGTTPVTCTCTDNGGLTSTCSFVIVVQATMLSCPTPVLFPSGDNDMLVVWNEFSCPSGKMIDCNGARTGQVYPPGMYTIMCSCEEAGFSDTCSFTFTIEASTEPLNLTCPERTSVSITPQGSGFVATAELPECTDTETGANLRVVCNVTALHDFPPGDYDVGCSCTHSSGTVKSCAYVLTFPEPPPPNTPPTITCPDSSVRKTPLVNGSTEVTWSNTCTDMEDEQGELNVMCNVSQPGIFQPGESYIRCNCTDTMDSVDECDFLVTITEPPPPNTPPTITCPDSSVRKTPLVDGSTEVTWSTICTDTEDEQGELNVMCNVSQPGIFQPGQSYIRCNCTDTMGSVDECDFLVTITEPPPPSNTPPRITCPDSSAVRKTPLLVSGSTEVTWSTTCTDTEDGEVELTVMCNVSQPGIFQPGQSYINCNCTDTMGGVDQCEFLVTITAPTPSNTPPRVTCPESSSVTTTRLPNGDFNVTWANTCTDTEDGPLVSVTCNVSQGSLQPGETYINCGCTDSMGSVDTCDFLVTITDPGPRPTPDIPSPTENCQIPVLENTVFNCTDGMGGVQTNCSLGCTNNAVKTIPDFGLISCRNNRWEPRVLDRLCQRPVEPISRSVLINVPVDTSSPDCREPRNLDNGIKMFFSNMFSTALMASCSSGIQEDSCTQSTTLDVNSVCLTKLGSRRRRQIQRKAVLNVTLNVTSSRDNQFVLSVAENVIMGIQNYRNSPPIDLETTEYTATLTEENRQAIWKSNITHNCLSGHAPVLDGYCVLCPPGTYLSDANSACKLCESGMYQDRPGQSECKKCEFTNDDLPGSTECQKPPEMSPDQDSGIQDSILFIAIGIAAVLALFVAILSFVTLCMCCGVKDGEHNETVEHGQTAYDIDEERRLQRLEQEAEIALQDYAGRDETDDEHIDDNVQYSQDSYDSPPSTRKDELNAPATTDL